MDSAIAGGDANAAIHVTQALAREYDDVDVVRLMTNLIQEQTGLPAAKISELVALDYVGEADPKKQCELGDRWLAASAGLPKDCAAPLKNRAAYWYAICAANPLGLVIKEKAMRDFVSLTGAAREEKVAAEIGKKLVGSWDVRKKDYHKTWDFFADGRVTIRGLNAPIGHWKVEPKRVFIEWGGRYWDSFQLPLDERTEAGDAWDGANVVKAKKIGNVPQ